MTINAGLSDRLVRRIHDTGTAAERAEAKAELIRRGLLFTDAQHRANRKPKPFERTEGSWGWGGQS